MISGYHQLHKTLFVSLVNALSEIKGYCFLFVFVALSPKSTAMVMAGGSVQLTTFFILFSGQA